MRLRQVVRELFHTPPTKSEFGPGQTRTSSLGAARPLRPSADIGPGGQSCSPAVMTRAAQSLDAACTMATTSSG